MEIHSDERGNAASYILRIQPVTKLHLSWTFSSPKDFCRCCHLWSLEEPSKGGRPGSLSVQCILLYARLYALLWMKHLNKVNASYSHLNPNVSSPPPLPESSVTPSWFSFCVCVWCLCVNECGVQKLQLSSSITRHFILRWNLSLNLELSHSAYLASQQVPRTLCSPPAGLGLQVYPLPPTTSFLHRFWELKTGPHACTAPRL